MRSVPAPASRVAAAVGAVALVLGAGAGCAAVLDWSGFSGEGGGGGSDAGDAGEGSVEAAPKCGPGSGCGGCCNADGVCVGGASVGTCGSGGVACVDCKPSGQVCSAGACVAAPVDAAPPPPCDPDRCATLVNGIGAAFDAGLCAPVYETACCKSDGTCGCMVEIPMMGQCM
jgi:hypothetical protein